MAQAGTLFGGRDFARDAGVVERGHVNQEAAGKSDVARDARAFFAQRLLGDLDDDFLALLQHVGNQLRAARLLRAMMTLAVLRTAIAVVAASAIALAAASGILHARAEVVAYARLRWRLPGRPRIFRRHGDIVRGRLRFGIQMLGMFRVFGVKLADVI